MLDWLEDIFITFFNMTLTGSYIILGVILIRLLLQNSPKIFSYALWSIAGLRLIFPFSFSSALSIFNLFSVPVQTASSGNATVNNYVPNDIGMMKTPEISTGIKAADTVINPFLPVAGAGDSVNPMQVVTAVASILWAAGIIGMAVYGIVSLLKVKKKVEFATKLDGNVFECDKIRSPFVFGIFRPKIYLPCGMDKKQREYVILHERNHIRRLDHITKLVSFAVLMLHWYNPLVWVGFSLMVHDMEMSCDEKVLRTLEEDEKKSYGLTLVSIGSNSRFAAGAPLSFGENVVEKRIVNVLKFKKPKVIAIILCIILCTAVGIICLTNSENGKSKNQIYEDKIIAFMTEDGKSPVDPYEMYIAGAEVTYVDKSNNAVYGWNCSYFFNTEYKNLIRYKEIVSEEELRVTSPFKATLDENGEVISMEVCDWKTDPKYFGELADYDTMVYEKAMKKALEEYEKLYQQIKVYPTENFVVVRSNPEINKVKITNHELVSDHLGKIYLVLSLKSSGEIGEYYIREDFYLEKYPGEGRLDALHPSDGKTVSLLSYQSNYREELWFGDFSMYVTSLENAHYVVGDIPVEMGLNIKDSIFVEFDVTDVSSPSTGNPELIYDNINIGVDFSINTAIRRASAATIFPDSSFKDGFEFTLDEIEAVVDLYNRTTFRKAADGKYDDLAYVSIEQMNGTIRTFSIATGGIIKDPDGNCYECDSPSLFKTVHNIAVKHGIITETEGINQDISETLAPTLATPLTQPEMPTTSVPENEVTDPSKGLIVYDIESEIPEELGLRLMGMDVTGRDFLEISFYNSSDRYLYIVPNQVMLKEVNGEFENIRIYNDYEPQTNLVAVAPKSFVTVQFPFGYYFNDDESVDGRYSFVTSVDYGTAEGADESQSTLISFKFSVGEREFRKAISGAEINGNPIMISAISQNAQSFVFNMYTDEEMKEIVRLFNSLEAEKLPRGDAATNQLMVTVADDKGNVYCFEIEPDGNINWEFYAENGAELYEAIQTPALNAAK